MLLFAGPNIRLTEDMKRKIALFCDIDANAVIECQRCGNPYEVPMMLREQGLDDFVVNHLKLETNPAGYDANGKAWLSRVKSLTANDRNCDCRKICCSA